MLRTHPNSSSPGSSEPGPTHTWAAAGPSLLSEPVRGTAGGPPGDRRPISCLRGSFRYSFITSARAAVLGSIQTVYEESKSSDGSVRVLRPTVWKWSIQCAGESPESAVLSCDIMRRNSISSVQANNQPTNTSKGAWPGFRAPRRTHRSDLHLCTVLGLSDWRSKGPCFHLGFQQLLSPHLKSLSLWDFRTTCAPSANPRIPNTADPPSGLGSALPTSQRRQAFTETLKKIKNFSGRKEIVFRYCFANKQLWYHVNVRLFRIL